MVNKKKGVFKRKEYPVAKDSKLNDIADKDQLKILKGHLKKGSAFIVLGSVHSPRKELLNAIRLEMKSPTSNGIMTYDANVPYKEQQERDIITVSINDHGNANIIHSIKRLGAERSRTLYSFEGGNEDGKDTSSTT